MKYDKKTHDAEFYAIGLQGIKYSAVVDKLRIESRIFILFYNLLFILEIFCDIALHFHARFLLIKNAFSVRFLSLS